MRYKGVLFDLDGTIVDTTDLIIHTFQHTFKEVLGIEVSRADVIKDWGLPLYDTMKSYDTERAQYLTDFYREYNAIKHDELIKPIKNVASTLQELHNMGVVCAVVTTKLSSVAQRGLDIFNLQKYMQDVIGSDKCQHHKPHPEPVLRGLKSLNLPADDCLMVGDSPYDLLSANYAGVKSIGVSWSIFPLEKLIKEGNPCCMIDDIKEILPIVKGE